MQTSTGYAPAKLLGITLSPSNRINLDSNLHDIGGPLASLLMDVGLGKVRITGNSSGNPIYGRSWEMAAAMASQGHSGSYTGTVSKYENGMVHFGAVPDVDVKDDLDSNLISYSMVKPMIVSHGR